MENEKYIYQLGRGFNKGGLHEICPTLSSHSWEQNNFVVEKTYLGCAMRGRNPDNPSDRTAGVPTEQRIEVNQYGGISNTITTVSKDSLVLEIIGDDKNQ